MTETASGKLAIVSAKNSLDLLRRLVVEGDRKIVFDVKSGRLSLLDTDHLVAVGNSVGVVMRGGLGRHRVCHRSATVVIVVHGKALILEGARSSVDVGSHTAKLRISNVVWQRDRSLAVTGSRAIEVEKMRIFLVAILG